MIKHYLLFAGLLLSVQIIAQTGIGTTTPDPSAKLHVASTDKGLLIPRMTLAQRTNISNPANGLMVYQTDDVTGFYVNTGSSGTPSWIRVNTDWTKSGNDISFSGGNVSITGNQTVSGNVTANNFIGSGSQLTNVLTKVTGSWVLAPSSNNVSFSLPGGGTYAMWVYGNIPNGIVMWNATVTNANTNVPVVGSQYGWYYSVGNALVLNSIPNQITGTNNGISTTPTSYAPNTSNIFKFGITNNSGVNQTIYWGYTRLD
jgi:hypothetical protein